MKLFRVICCCFVLLLSLVVFGLFHGFQASAASGRVTKGDVESILHTGGSANAGAILFHKNPVPGFEDARLAAITPLSFTSGRHYCVDDWHVVRLATDNSVDNVFFFTKEQAIADLEATTTTITLDGVSLPLTQTPIVRVSATVQQLFGLPGPAWAFQTGSILSPTDLRVGDHTAGVVQTDPVFGTFTDSSTFTVDASGTGVCLQG